MAQHDMNIANQGFPATRADLNNALQALVSNSSGATEPSTTFANQWWYDTTNNKMYLRNEANNAWIEVAVLDQTNNEWQISTGVVQAKDSDGLALNTDDGTTRLFIRDSDGNIGIGTTNPTYARLTIFDDNSDIDMDANGSGQLLIDGNGYAFSVALNADGAQLYTNTASRDLIFGTDETERMRITDGNVGIGTSSPNDKVDISGSTGDGYRLTDGTHTGVFRSISGGTILKTASNHALMLGTNDTERMRIDSTGNVGIGISPPSTYWGSSDNVALFTPHGYLGSNGDFAVSLYSNGYRNTSGGFTYLGINGNTSTASGIDLRPEANIIFRTGTASGTALPERMRIDSGGDILFGCTSLPAAGVGGAAFEDATSNRMTLRMASTTTGSIFLALMYNPNGAVGSITTSGSSTSFNTSSDYRLKENVTDVTDGITRVKQLSPKRFNFIADADTTVDGFLAHEAQAVVPEAVTGTHNGMQDEEYQVSAATGDIYTPAVDAVVDEEGNELSAAVDEVIHSSNVEQPETLEEGQFWRETTAAVMGTRSVPDYQGIDQSKLVPLLTAALQEAIAKIEALETRVAALEG